MNKPNDVQNSAPDDSVSDDFPLENPVALSCLNLADKLVLALTLAQGWTDSHHDSESPFYGRFSGAFIISLHVSVIYMFMRALGLIRLDASNTNWLSGDLLYVVCAGVLALMYGIIHLLTSSNDILRRVQLSEESRRRYWWGGVFLILSPFIPLAFFFIWLLGFSGEFWQIW